MKEITSAIISSFFKDLSSRKAKIILICFASVILIVIALIVLRHRPQSPPVPVREVTLTAPSITDQYGNQWTLDLVRGQRLSNTGNNINKPGPPLIVKTNIHKINENLISIGITVEGRAGEKYVGGARKNGKQEPEPRFNIVDQKGRVLAAGKFEYG